MKVVNKYDMQNILKSYNVSFIKEVVAILNVDLEQFKADGIEKGTIYRLIVTLPSKEDIIMGRPCITSDRLEIKENNFGYYCTITIGALFRELRYRYPSFTTIVTMGLNNEENSYCLKCFKDALDMFNCLTSSPAEKMVTIKQLQSDVLNNLAEKGDKFAIMLAVKATQAIQEYLQDGREDKEINFSRPINMEAVTTLNSVHNNAAEEAGKSLLYQVDAQMTDEVRALMKPEHYDEILTQVLCYTYSKILAGEDLANINNI